MTPKTPLAIARRARIAKKYGFHHAWRIGYEAHRAGIAYDLAFAMVEQESGNGANVFGHDFSIFSGAGVVTQVKYLAYKRLRGTKYMQGVGPMQLTWWSTQDAADRLGGCWVPKYNLRVGFITLKSLIHSYGLHDGVMHYNGSGSAAQTYATQVLIKKMKWHKRFK